MILIEEEKNSFEAVFVLPLESNTTKNKHLLVVIYCEYENYLILSVRHIQIQINDLSL